MPAYDFRCAEGHRFERMVPLARFAEVQHCDCGAPSQRLVCAPAVRSDAIPPTRGADGKIHDSLASYRHSLTPEGNAKGERYLELSPGETMKHVEHKSDPKKLRDDLRKTVAEYQQGRRVAPTTGVVT